jgi:hypothetical protein
LATIVEFVKICAILAASAMLGNWFLTEVKASKLKGEPWYSPYFSLPGILIICIIILLPILAWLFRR